MVHKGIPSGGCKQRLSTSERISKTQEERLQRCSSKKGESSNRISIG